MSCYLSAEKRASVDRNRKYRPVFVYVIDINHDNCKHRSFAFTFGYTTNDESVFPAQLVVQLRPCGYVSGHVVDLEDSRVVSRDYVVTAPIAGSAED